MSSPVDTAKAKATQARSRLKDSAATVKGRLSAQALKKAAINGASKKAVGIGLGVAKAARSRPLLSVGIMAATALVILRKPVIGAIRRLSKEKDNG